MSVFPEPDFIGAIDNPTDPTKLADKLERSAALMFYGKETEHGRLLYQAATALRRATPPLDVAKLREVITVPDASGTLWRLEKVFAMKPADRIEQCNFRGGEVFRVIDAVGDHDPAYLVLPGGEMIPFNHWNDELTDVARAVFIAEACNAALASQDAPSVDTTPQPGEAAALAGELNEAVSLIDRSIWRACEPVVALLRRAAATLSRQEPDAGAVERVVEAGEIIAIHMNERLYNGRVGERPAAVDRALRTLRDARAALVPADPAKGES